MLRTKGILESKTIWGVIISLAAKLTMGAFGIEITEDTQQQLAIVMLTLVGAVADIGAIYGRLVAKIRIGSGSKTILPVLLCVMLLGGCSSLSCIDKVAVTEVTITEAIQLTQIASDADIVEEIKIRKDIILIKSANMLSDQAYTWCDIEEPTALDYILQADFLIVEVETLIGE